MQRRCGQFVPVGVLGESIDLYPVLLALKYQPEAMRDDHVARACRIGNVERNLHLTCVGSHPDHLAVFKAERFGLCGMHGEHAPLWPVVVPRRITHDGVRVLVHVAARHENERVFRAHVKLFFFTVRFKLPDPVRKFGD